jgi:hypothetical protein
MATQPRPNDREGRASVIDETSRARILQFLPNAKNTPDNVPEGRPNGEFCQRLARSLGEICDTVAPPWQEAGTHHRIRCHIPLPPLAAMPHWLGRRDMS